MQGWGGGEDEWRVTANGDRVSFWGDGDILESGDGLHNIVNVLNATKLWTYKMDEMIKFCYIRTLFT